VPCVKPQAQHIAAAQPVGGHGANTRAPSVSPQATAPFSLEQRAPTAHDALTFM
jgi:hypothetical protein